MELASAIASDLLRTCGDVFTIQIVPPGWIHFELTDLTLATWLQSLAVGELGGAGSREQGAGGRGERGNFSSPPCPPPPAPVPLLPNSLFAVQHAHARCCSLVLLAHREGLIKLKQAVTNASQGFWDVISPNPLPWLNCDETLRLNHPDELHLISELIQTVDKIECPKTSGSVKWEKVALNLSQAFENFWCNCRIWGEVKITFPELAQARLGLLMATQSLLRYLLEEKLGVFAPLEL
ncbi:MAG: DALR anticodon-binding domain-containing protein [Nostoc sp. DedVER02]|uniref:DALR anticodon-binding domain-containing protein n=1 Tax=unclassified Nostoc TaxID=2593658 RepID=UPI002AD2C389|nr:MULTISPECIES: DALR anticodon-binding domain-containing protein [unclassified Nostoc]MDZ7990199.1 DALR anticodon-binding domain-containing protein [Nostoc sp. DedVER02]MDZ8116414.1 DALR anticodon-binding domain-containing protein [Nostoc sp. DedVER01b]